MGKESFRNEENRENYSENFINVADDVKNKVEKYDSDSGHGVTAQQSVLAIIESYKGLAKPNLIGEEEAIVVAEILKKIGGEIESQDDKKNDLKLGIKIRFDSYDIFKESLRAMAEKYNQDNPETPFKFEDIERPQNENEGGLFSYELGITNEYGKFVTHTRGALEKDGIHKESLDLLENSFADPYIVGYNGRFEGGEIVTYEPRGGSGSQWPRERTNLNDYGRNFGNSFRESQPRLIEGLMLWLRQQRLFFKNKKE